MLCDAGDCGWKDLLPDPNQVVLLWAETARLAVSAQLSAFRTGAPAVIPARCSASRNPLLIQEKPGFPLSRE